MFREIAIIAPGAMGSAVARRLTDHGVRVITVLEGRSAGTRSRAETAGMIGVEMQRIAEADVILSIVPPAQAVTLAVELAPLLRSNAHQPIFVDCNAIDVRTVRRVGDIVTASGTRFVDAAIIGFPPVPDAVGPTFYFSGEPARELGGLAQLGLNTRIIEGPVGAASALKMSYAGINKGLTGIAAAMVLAASRAGATIALREELQASQPQLLERLTTTLPDMYPKAYRWVAEMREIAAFAGDSPATARLYEALGDFFESIATDHTGARVEIATINGFLAGPSRQTE